MKCESAQQNLLKEQTGELAGFAKRRTSRHLRDCAACRQFREETAHVLELAHSPEPSRRVRPDTMERIMQAAREEKSRGMVIQIQPDRESFLFRRHPALIYAAASIVLGVGVWLTLRPDAPSSPGADLTKQDEPRIMDTVEAVLIAKEPESTAPDRQVLAGAELSWDSPIGDELAALNLALFETASENIFAEAHPNGHPDQNPEDLIRELLELEGVQI